MLIVELFLAATLGVILMAIVAAARRADLQATLRRVEVLAAGGAWLARYNRAHALALHRVLMDETGLSHHDVNLLSMKWMDDAERQADLGQTIPLNRVPILQRSTAILYNYYATSGHDDRRDDIAIVGLEDAAEARVRQLETAVGVARMGLDEPLPEEEVRAVAREFKLSYVVAESVLLHVRHMVRGRMDYALRVRSAEEMLPSIY